VIVSRLLKTFLLLSLLLTAFSFSAVADIYYSGNMGIVSVSDADLDNGTDTGEMSFDDGFAATGAVGASLGNHARLELELGYRKNNLDKFSVAGYGTVNGSGDLRTISLMGNVYYDFLKDSVVRPFVGAGLGAANIEADIDRLDSEDDNVFAYQLAAGGTIAVREHLNIDIQYRYFGTQDPDFSGVKAEYHTHNIFIGLRLQF